MQIGSRWSYTYSTDARHQAPARTPLAPSSPPPEDQTHSSKHCLFNSCSVFPDVFGQCWRFLSHRLLHGCSQPALRLDHLTQLSHHGRRQLHVQNLRISRHLTHQLLVGEDAVALQTPVVCHTLSAEGQLHTHTHVTHTHTHRAEDSQWLRGHTQSAVQKLTASAKL